MSDAKSEGIEDHAYFQAVERVFIELRGSPLLLSPADWQIARGWRRQGIPLRLVGGTLREVFERREREGKGADKVLSLRYLRSAVEKAWKRERELMTAAPSEAPAFDLKARLQALASALGENLPDRDLWRRRIDELEGSVELVEASLAEIDGEVLAATVESLPEREAEAVEIELAGALEALSRRLPVAEVEASSERLRERLLRRRVGLPVLSLFAPEADPSRLGS